MPAGRQGRRREIDSSIIIRALTDTRTMEQAASLVGCSAPAISARAKQDVEVKQAIREQERARENDIAEAIIECRGILSKVAEKVGLGSGAVRLCARLVACNSVQGWCRLVQFDGEGRVQIQKDIATR